MLGLLNHNSEACTMASARAATAVCGGAVDRDALATIRDRLTGLLAARPEDAEYFLLDVFCSFWQIYREAKENGGTDAACAPVYEAAMASVAFLWPETAMLDTGRLEECGACFLHLGVRSMYRQENLTRLCDMADELAAQAPVTTYLIRRNLLNFLIFGDAFLAFPEETKTLTEQLAQTDPEFAALCNRANIRFMR